MAGFGTDTFQVWLTNRVGPATTSANVLFHAVLTFPNSGGGLSGMTVSTSANVALTPGTYYLVLSSSQSSSIYEGWLESSAVLTSQFGQVPNQLESTSAPFGGVFNSQFPPASTFTLGANPSENNIHALAFQLLQ